MTFRSLSLWWDQLPDEEVQHQRRAAQGTLSCDVTIVGGGFTGLWTAYWLKKLDPELDIAIVEAEVVGFGASGRNGGWCSALFPASLEKIAQESGRNQAVAMHRTMQNYIAFLGQILQAEEIDCDWHHGGDLYLARTKPQVQRAQDELRMWREWGFSDEDHQWLSPSEASVRLNATHVMGASFTPHCARIHPAKLVRNLAKVVEKYGVRIYENSRVTGIEPHRVSASEFHINSKIVVRATEGYTATLPQLKRHLVPVYSLMVATEPLSDSTLANIGLGDRELFADYRHLIIYGQVTADNRIAFGGRGAPYHFGSSVSGSFDRNRKVHHSIEKVLRELLPQLQTTTFTHHWGGPLAISRDWYPSVNFDKKSGLASAGGYVGDGVATSALAGHTLAELITSTDTERTSLPWVNRVSPKWELEPLRWLGTNAGLRMMTLADAEEGLTHRPSVLASAFAKVSGR